MWLMVCLALVAVGVVILACLSIRRPDAIDRELRALIRNEGRNQK